MEGTDQIVGAGGLGQLRRNPQAAGADSHVEKVLEFLDLAEETESGLVEWRAERKAEKRIGTGLEFRPGIPVGCAGQRIWRLLHAM